jgi:hypothetical protein
MSNFVKSKFGTILVLIATVILAGIAIFTAVRLYKLRQEAVAPNAPTSKPAAAACVEQCPGSDGILRNCHPPDSDGTSQDSVCNTSFKGRVEFCGTKNYCCNGTSWTTTMTACASASPSVNPSSNPVQCEVLSFTISMPSTSPSPSPSVSPSPSATASPSVSPSPTSTATSTSTATAIPTSTATAAPQAELPEAGTSLPTIIGLGSGLILILISLIIAL